MLACLLASVVASSFLLARAKKDETRREEIGILLHLPSSERIPINSTLVSSKTRDLLQHSIDASDAFSTIMQPQPPSSAASVAAAAAAEAPAVDLPPPPPHSRRSCGSSSWLRLGRSRRVSALSNHHSSKATRSKACANKSSQKISNSNNSNMMMYSSTSPPHCSSFSSASSPPPLSSSPSLLTWLETTCPPELVPKILAMAGPHTMRSMLGVNRYWKHVMQDDDNATTTTTTWKSICQETNKVRRKEMCILEWLCKGNRTNCNCASASCAGCTHWCTRRELTHFTHFTLF